LTKLSLLADTFYVFTLQSTCSFETLKFIILHVVMQFSVHFILT